MIRIAAYAPEIALNLGNTIRTAACFDLPVSVIEPCGFPFSLKALRRSAMDYADLAQIDHHLDWATFCRNVPARRVLLTTKASTPYTQFQFQAGDALILGRESSGVPPEVVDDCEAQVTIPMSPNTRSLNVSTSAAIVVAEALRQLDAFPQSSIST